MSIHSSDRSRGAATIIVSRRLLVGEAGFGEGLRTGPDLPERCVDWRQYHPDMPSSTTTLPKVLRLS
jgi:hypothetical protein